MIPFLAGAFTAGIAGAVGAKIGADYVYPWVVKKTKELVNTTEKAVNSNLKDGGNSA